jgi:hypothetical protein
MLYRINTSVNSIMTLNLCIVVILVVIVFFYNTESFSMECLPENNCFKGAYLRSQAYQNVCPPDYGNLDRTKVQLQDGCLRTLGNYPAPKYRFDCYIDDRLHRHCRWVIV